MTVGNNPADRSKLGPAKKGDLTDKYGIPLSADITSAISTHDIKAVTDVIDNAVVLNRYPNLPFTKKKTRRPQHKQQEHLCLDRAYSSKSIENEIIKRGYVPHILYNRKRGQKKEEVESKKRNFLSKNKRWVILERTNAL